MANERDPNMSDTGTQDESLGGGTGELQQDSSRERIGGLSGENMRGTGDDEEEDEFDDTDDLDDEEEDETEGTI